MADLATLVMVAMAMHPVIDEVGSNKAVRFRCRAPTVAPAAQGSPNDQAVDADKSTQSAFRKQVRIDPDLTVMFNHFMPVCVIGHFGRLSANFGTRQLARFAANFMPGRALRTAETA